jgi:predicted ATPase
LVQGLPPESDYRFKHALIQDAAYENLLKSQRQVLHRRVAEALREDAVAAVAEPELLAPLQNRQVSSKRLLNGGVRRDSGHWSARRWSKPWNSSSAL